MYIPTFFSLSLTKNEKTVGSGSTDLILPLSRLNQHLLRYSRDNTIYVYVFRIIQNIVTLRLLL